MLPGRSLWTAMPRLTEPLRVDRRLQLLRSGAMTSKTTNKFSSEVRARAVRMVLEAPSG